MKKGSLAPNLKLALPASDEASLSKFLTQSGTFMDGDLLVNRNGVRIVSQPEVETPPLIQPSDNQLSLADFDAIKIIGKGAGGIVRLVQHKWTGQFFALKVIQMNIEESARKQIAQELKINQSSQCQHVVVCYQSFYENGTISIILEYMDGGSLADFLRKVQSIPEKYLAVICKQVLEGLWYLHHEKHIIHRDLKPSNLLINHRGEVKITDFGVSTILASTSGLANTFVGTYNYMSPERIIGGNHGYKSDIWSFGLVILECAIGHFPYCPPQQGEGWTNVFELMETIVEELPPRPPSEQFSPEFCSFISAWYIFIGIRFSYCTRILLSHGLVTSCIYPKLCINYIAFYGYWNEVIIFLLKRLCSSYKGPSPLHSSSLLPSDISPFSSFHLPLLWIPGPLLSPQGWKRGQ